MFVYSIKLIIVVLLYFRLLIEVWCHQMKRRVSYSRITGTAFLIIVLIFGIDFLRRSTANKSTDEELEKSIKVSTESASDDQTDIPEGTDLDTSDNLIELGTDNYKYQDVEQTSADMCNGPLVLVNKDHPFEDSSSQDNIIKISDEKKTNSYKLAYLTLRAQKSIIPSLSAMLDEFNKNFSHNDVTVSSSYVSYDDQNQKYIGSPTEKEYITSEQMMAPGYTEHHTGYAVDFLIVSENMNISQFDGSGDYSWIINNCYKYGFVQRYPSSKEASTGVENIPGHFRYVGIPHSYIMHDKEFTLEEYLTFLKDYSYSGEHFKYELPGYKYEIYYVPSQGDLTQVPVPYEFQNTISGNNDDGFIVTVTTTDQTSMESTNDTSVTTTPDVTSAVTSAVT